MERQIEVYAENYTDEGPFFVSSDKKELLELESKEDFKNKCFDVHIYDNMIFKVIVMDKVWFDDCVEYNKRFNRKSREINFHYKAFRKWNDAINYVMK